MINKLKIFLSLALILLITAGAAERQVQVPYGLMVEFIRDPAGTNILDLNPEFSWIVSAKSGVQSARQILVSSSMEKAENNIGDVWDSGKVEDNYSSEVETEVTLKENCRYFWKVRIWDRKKRPTGFSEAQSFTTGRAAGHETTRSRFLSTADSPKSKSGIAEDHYFADFGKDAFGALILEFQPLQADTLIVHLGEKLSGPSQIDRKPGGSIRYQKVYLPVSPGITNYIVDLPPDARNTGGAAVHLPDSFGVIMPFRYCELENCRYDIKDIRIYRKTYNYYFNDIAASFTSSDTLLNHVWELCRYSIKATSFAGLYIDGDRERIPYEADAYINQLGHYYTDREYSMARATNEYFISHPTWPTEWILHTVLMFHNDLMFTGNTESANRYYNELKHKTLISLARDDGLISSADADEEIMKALGFSNPKERIRDIVDWPPAQKDTGWKLAGPDGERDGYDMVRINTVVNAFYYRNLVLMAETGRILGFHEDASCFSTLALKVKKSFNEKLLDSLKGIYVDGENSVHSSLHANMMALAFDLVPDEYLKSVIAFIKSRGMACSVYGAQYLLEGLYKYGESGYAYNLLTATNDRSWWNMIRSGSTISMEAWDMKYKPNSDWNHAWGAAPANIIPGYMWGIRPSEPGFAKCIIKPQLSELKHSKVAVPTIRGTITAEFRDKGRLKIYLITIPGNMECDFEPGGKSVYRLKAGLNRVEVKY